MLDQYIPKKSGNLSTVVSDHDKVVTRYREQLTNYTRDNTQEGRKKVEAYRAEAIKSVLVDEQEVRIFAPFRLALSALKTTTSRQRFILRVLGLTYVVGLLVYSTIALQIIIAIITFFYLTNVIIHFCLSVRVIGQATEIQVDDEVVNALADANWPYYTILCPLYREAEVVPQFVKAMKELDYPAEKLQILFLTEEDDVTTRTSIEALQLPSHFMIVTVPDGQPRTKPRACNFGLLEAMGDYVVIYDAEDIPDPLQLKKVVLAFAGQGDKTACIQAKLNFYNSEQNVLTRWFTAEYSSWFDLVLPGLQLLGVPLPLGGTSNHFRLDLLRLAGGWDAFNVTEDCDLGLRLGHYGLKTVVVDSTTYEEANSQFKNWLRQRSRWIKGYMQTYLVHMRDPLGYLRTSNIRAFLSLQLFIGSKTAILLVNPLMWLLVGIYILLHAFVVDAYHTLYPTPVLYMGTLCLIFGNFIYTYSHLIGCMKRSQYKLIKWTLLIPIYWAMGSIAAYIALYQLIFMPHYWEKTLHGLHLRKVSNASQPPPVPEQPLQMEEQA